MKLQADNYNGVCVVKDFDNKAEYWQVENFYHQLTNNPDDKILATEIDEEEEMEYYDKIKAEYGISEIK